MQRQGVAAAIELVPEQATERLVGELGLLQADDIGLPLVEPRQQPWHSLLDRVDIPRRHSHGQYASRADRSRPEPDTAGHDAAGWGRETCRLYETLTSVAFASSIVPVALATMHICEGSRGRAAHRHLVGVAADQGGERERERAVAGGILRGTTRVTTSVRGGGQPHRLPVGEAREGVSDCRVQSGSA